MASLTRVDAKLPELNEGNFPIWRPKMKLAIDSAGLGAYLEKPEEGDAPADAVQDAKVRGVIGLHVSDDLLPLLDDCRYAWQMWETLVSMYARRSSAARVHLHRDLATISKSESESMEMYFSRAKRLRSQLTEIGKSVDEDTLVMYLLAGLPSSYSTPISILTAGNTQLCLDVSLQHLLQHEAMLSSPLVGDGAAMYSKSGKSGGRFGGKPGGADSRSNSAANRFGSKQDKAKKKAEKKCYHCNQAGHFRASCPQLRGAAHAAYEDAALFCVADLVAEMVSIDTVLEDSVFLNTKIVSVDTEGVLSDEAVLLNTGELKTGSDHLWPEAELKELSTGELKTGSDHLWPEAKLKELWHGTTPEYLWPGAEPTEEWLEAGPHTCGHFKAVKPCMVRLMLMEQPCFIRSWGALPGWWTVERRTT
jgi:gag-polypeptide of LTR copia-type/Zinc knuckle